MSDITKKGKEIMNKSKKIDKYCGYCGKKMILVWTNYYDEKTGEKKYVHECDVKDCKHGYHDFGWGIYSFKCKVCGLIEIGD